jgi:hypothetical protein
MVLRLCARHETRSYKIAFKHATTVYSREKEKKGGMLALT